MRYLSDCAPLSLPKSPYLGAKKDVNQHTSICVKENEQVANKKLPLQVQNSVTCVVSAPISLFPPPQHTGATGNWALRKICSFHLQPEITSKAVKIHGKNMWIFVSDIKGLEKAWHFSLAFHFGALHQQPLVLIKCPRPGSTHRCLQILCHYSLLSLHCGDPTEPDPRC